MYIGMGVDIDTELMIPFANDAKDI